jgi:hypothetical protein
MYSCERDIPSYQEALRTAGRPIYDTCDIWKWAPLTFHADISRGKRHSRKRSRNSKMQWIMFGIGFLVLLPRCYQDCDANRIHDNFIGPFRCPDLCARGPQHTSNIRTFSRPNNKGPEIVTLADKYDINTVYRSGFIVFEQASIGIDFLGIVSRLLQFSYGLVIDLLSSNLLTYRGQNVLLAGPRISRIQVLNISGRW